MCLPFFQSSFWKNRDSECEQCVVYRAGMIVWVLFIGKGSRCNCSSAVTFFGGFLFGGGGGEGTFVRVDHFLLNCGCSSLTLIFITYALIVSSMPELRRVDERVVPFFSFSFFVSPSFLDFQTLSASPWTALLGIIVTMDADVEVNDERFCHRLFEV